LEPRTCTVAEALRKQLRDVFFGLELDWPGTVLPDRRPEPDTDAVFSADGPVEIATVEEEARHLEEQVKAFRVVPQYEELKHRADDIDRGIRSSNAQDAVDRRSLSGPEAAVTEATDHNVRCLEPVHHGLGILLGDQVKRRFTDVKGFHESIVRNRRRYLAEEIRTIEARLAQRAAEREALGTELERVPHTLDEGGTLEGRPRCSRPSRRNRRSPKRCGTATGRRGHWRRAHWRSRPSVPSSGPR